MARILVVDDSALARRMMRQILEPAGYQVIEANDGYAALEQYGLERPDAVMLDLLMAGMTGLEVLIRLRELDPGTVVVVATADVQRETQAIAASCGASGYVTKPFASEKILSALRAALEGGGSGRREDGNG